MDAASLTDRDVASLLEIPINTVRSGEYDDDLLRHILVSMETIGGRQLFIFEGNRAMPFTTGNIYQAAMQVKLRYGLGMIVVDYLGLLRDRYGSNQNDRLGFITAALKSMAMEFQVPVLCASQLSRSLESQDDKRPQLHDLRDSGNIEQDADVVLFLYRESYYGKTGNETEIIIAKQRQGPSGGRKVRVYFDRKAQLYRDMPRTEEQNV